MLLGFGGAGAPLEPPLLLLLLFVLELLLVLAVPLLVLAAEVPSEVVAVGDAVAGCDAQNEHFLHLHRLQCEAA